MTLLIVKRIYNSKKMRVFSETLSHTDWSEMYTAKGTREAFDLFHNKRMALNNKHFPKIRIKRDTQRGNTGYLKLSSILSKERKNVLYLNKVKKIDLR